MSYSIHYTNKFKKDYKKAVKQGKDIAKFQAVVDLLIEGEPLPEKNRDHSLSGNYEGYRDCHIEPDWLLIYKIDEGEIILTRMGSHSDLF